MRIKKSLEKLPRTNMHGHSARFKAGVVGEGGGGLYIFIYAQRKKHSELSERAHSLQTVATLTTTTSWFPPSKLIKHNMIRGKRKKKAVWVEKRDPSRNGGAHDACNRRFFYGLYH